MFSPRSFLSVDRSCVDLFQFFRFRQGTVLEKLGGNHIEFPPFLQAAYMAALLHQ